MIFSPLKNLKKTQPRRLLCNRELNPNCGPIRKLGDREGVDFGLDTLIFLFPVPTPRIGLQGE